MKAIQIKQTGGPEVMELVDLPVPQAKANEAVVKIAAAGVDENLQIKIRRRCAVPQAPVLAGSQAGPGVRAGRIRPGDYGSRTGGGAACAPAFSRRCEG
jgi:NADPH2:quinone reductase